MGSQDRSAGGRRSPLATGFVVRSDTAGRLRVRHPGLRGNRPLPRHVRSRLMRLEGVRRYRIGAETGSVLVEYAPEQLDPQQVLRALAEAEAAARAARASATADTGVPIAREVLQLSLSTAALGLAAAAAAWPALGAAALAVTAAAGLHTLAQGFRGLVRGRPGVDGLDSLVIVLALAHRYTLPAAAMVWLLNLGERLVEATDRGSRELVAEMFGEWDPHVRRLTEGGATEEVPLSSLRAGDAIEVLAGDVVPVDGTVVAGALMVDLSLLTGEHAPVDRGPGDEVLARTRALAGRVEVRVLGSGADTYAGSLMRILERSLQHRVRLQGAGERFADLMVLPTLALGGAAHAAAGPSAMLAVLNADFGTGIRLAAPAAMLASIAAAVEHAIFVKDGGALERLREVDAIVFDKTGTLTEAQPEVARVVSFGRGWTEPQLLARVAAAETRFRHPLARAIVDEARRRGLAFVPLGRADAEQAAGLGIAVTTEEGRLCVGSQRYAVGAGAVLTEAEDRLVREVDARGGTCVLALLDGRAMGLVELRAAPRPDAARVVEALRRRPGVAEVWLLSGDREAATARVARRLGIDRYRANVLPEEKAAHVRALQQAGRRVAMVGDGVNDSAALSQADCGVSLRGGADAAIDAAHVVLMDGRLQSLEVLWALSDDLRRTVDATFRLLVASNSLLIAGAMVGRFGMGASVVVNNALNLLATLYALHAQDALRTKLGPAPPPARRPTAPRRRAGRPRGPALPAGPSAPARTA